MKCYCREEYFEFLSREGFYMKNLKIGYKYRKDWEFDEVYVYWVENCYGDGIGFEEEEFKRYFYTIQDIRRKKIKIIKDK